MGEIIRLAGRHPMAPAGTRRSAGICIRAKTSYVTPGMPANEAPAITKSQYSTGIDPLRFCSLAVDGPLPMTLAKSVGPPKASISAGTVVGESRIASIYRISVDDVNRTSVENACDGPYMGDVGDRLRQARVRAKFTSARKAAQAMGVKESTYASHENGQTEPSRDDVQRYARRFKASTAWILTGDGPVGAHNLIPLVGRVGAGGDIDPDYEQVPEGGIDEVELPLNVGVDAVAFEIRGASMKPRYDHGALIVCTRSGRDPDGLIGIEAAIRTSDNKRFLKIIRPGRRRGLYTLESFNADPIVDIQIVWVGEVLAVIPAHRRVAAFSQKRRAAG